MIVPAYRSPLAFSRSRVLILDDESTISDQGTQPPAACPIAWAFSGPGATTWPQPRCVGMDERERELVAATVRAQAGDPEAFHYLFLRFAKPVLSFVYNLVGDRQRAEELTQETFIRAYRGLGSIRNAGQFSTWLFGIARNVVREAVRERYRHSPNVALDDPLALSVADGRPGADEELAATELGRTIRRALSSLSEDFRTVFVLKVLHQLSYDEIASITGASVGKLKTDLHRARLEMRHKLLTYRDRTGRIRGES